MSSRWRKLLLLPLVLSVALLASCGQDLTGPGTASIPEAAPEPQLQPSLIGDIYDLLFGKPQPGTVLQDVETIDRRGGVLYAGGHMLVVPANAVRNPTVFRMTVKPDIVGVKLTATSVALAAKDPGANDVGSAGFQRPVHLYLAYDRVRPDVDPKRVRVALRMPGGMVQPVPTVQWYGVAIGTIKHFSDYILIRNREGDPIGGGGGGAGEH